jgi:hypothetical protein
MSDDDQEEAIKLYNLHGSKSTGNYIAKQNKAAALPANVRK